MEYKPGSEAIKFYNVNLRKITEQGYTITITTKQGVQTKSFNKNLQDISYQVVGDKATSFDTLETISVNISSITDNAISSIEYGDYISIREGDIDSNFNARRYVDSDTTELRNLVDNADEVKKEAEYATRYSQQEKDATVNELIQYSKCKTDYVYTVCGIVNINSSIYKY